MINYLVFTARDGTVKDILLGLICMTKMSWAISMNSAQYIFLDFLRLDFCIKIWIQQVNQFL